MQPRVSVSDKNSINVRHSEFPDLGKDIIKVVNEEHNFWIASGLLLQSSDLGLPDIVLFLETQKNYDEEILETSTSCE